MILLLEQRNANSLKSLKNTHRNGLTSTFKSRSAYYKVAYCIVVWASNGVAVERKGQNGKGLVVRMRKLAHNAWRICAAMFL